jgi:hypothetical protein
MLTGSTLAAPQIKAPDAMVAFARVNLACLLVFEAGTLRLLDRGGLADFIC